MTKNRTFLFVLFTLFIGGLVASLDQGASYEATVTATLPTIDYEIVDSRRRPSPESLMRRVRFILLHELDSEIGRSMWHEIESENLKVEFRVGTSVHSADYSVIYPTQVISRWEDLEALEARSILSVDAKLLVDIEDYHGIAVAKAVLIHEFVHHQQWLRVESGFHRHDWARTLLVTDELHVEMEGATSEFCAQRVEREIEAYTVQCSLESAQTGSGWARDLCSPIYPETFRDHIIGVLIKYRQLPEYCNGHIY